METPALPDKTRIAFEGLLAGKSLDEAAKSAGFTNPSMQFYPAIRNQIAQRGIKGFLKARLQVEASPKAYKFLLSVLDDTQADAKLRVEVAKFLMMIAGYNPPKAEEAPRNDNDEKPPEEMTNEELRQYIERTEAELGKRATIIQPVETLNL